MSETNHSAQSLTGLTIEAVIIRADGSHEPQGVIARWRPTVAQRLAQTFLKVFGTEESK